MPKIVDHDERREEILSAAIRVIDSVGLDNTTTRAIALESGYSNGVLSHYFSGQGRHPAVDPGQDPPRVHGPGRTEHARQGRVRPAVGDADAEPPPRRRTPRRDADGDDLLAARGVQPRAAASSSARPPVNCSRGCES